IVLNNSDFKCIRDELNSVKILKDSDCNMYNVLLTKSIVFLCLKDASSVNTVIDCMVRNTPVLVNRLPALEEILGQEYPMFYSYNKNSIEETIKNAKAILTRPDIVKITTEYLKAISKSC